MSYNFTELCSKCGALVRIIEHPMEVPGGKEREVANCPNCNEILFSAMIDGCFSTSIIRVNQLSENID